MGLFRFNDRPGPGVDKDTPPKKGLFRWWEIFTRDFNAMLVGNLCLMVCAIPALTCAILFYVSCSAGDPWMLMLLLNPLAAILLGPALAASHRLTLNMCRDEPFFTWHEFKESFRQNFRQGAVTMVILAVLADMIMLNLYLLTVVEGYGMFMLIMLMLSIYIWISVFNTAFQQIAMMELKLTAIWKNSVILVLVAGWRGVVLVLFDLLVIVALVIYGIVGAPLLLFGFFMWIMMTGDLIFWPRFKQIFIDRDMRPKQRSSASQQWQEVAEKAAEKAASKPATPEQEWARAFLEERDELDAQDVTGEDAPEEE